MTTAIPAPTFLRRADHEAFRRSVGIRAVVTTEDEGGSFFEVDADVDHVSHQIALATIADAKAEAVEASIVADSLYRRWRADATADVLASDEKLAEWKVKARVEALDDFLAHKAQIAEIAGTIEFLTLLAQSVEADNS